MKKKNFTLIELIVVIAIIAILAAIIAPNAFKAIEKAKVSKAVSDIKAIKAAALAFYSDTKMFPCTKAGGWGKDPGFVSPITASNCWPDNMDSGGGEGDCSTPGLCIDIAGWNGPYLEKWGVSPWYKNEPIASFPDTFYGAYNWNRWSSAYSVDNVTCELFGIVSLENYGAISLESLQRIDAILDDGDLAGGYVHLNSPFSSPGDIDHPDILQFIAVCQ